jgi:hypothetical protein
VLTDRLEKHCIDAEPMLDKKTGSQKNGFSAHPVLWICRRFSTVGLVLHAKSRLQLSRMRRVRLVLPVDKTEVEQCLRLISHVATLFLL